MERTPGGRSAEGAVLRKIETLQTQTVVSLSLVNLHITDPTESLCHNLSRRTDESITHQGPRP